MIEYVITVVIFFALYFYYKFYYVPNKTLNWYKNTMQALGYKVKLLPFQMLGSPYFSLFQKAIKKHKDGMYFYKNQFSQYDVLLFNTLHYTTIQLLSPHLMKSFLTPQNVYIDFKLGMLVNNFRRSFGNGVLLSQGKQWKKKRQIMNSVFNYQFIIANIPKIIRICQQNFDLYQKQLEQQKDKSKQSQDGKVYQMDLLQLYARIYSNVILECFFGVVSTHEKIDGTTIAQFINKLNINVSEQGFQILTMMLGDKFTKLGLRKKDRDIDRRIKLLRNMGKQYIARRLKQLQKQTPRQKYQDIIQALVLKKRNQSNIPSKPNQQPKQTTTNPKVQPKKLVGDYNEQQLIDQFCTFVIAGTDTTTHFTQMMVYYISLNQRIQERLRKDINQVIKTDQDITKQNLKKLTYIDWLQYQTLRCYGPVNGIFHRIAQKDHFIANIPIKKGTTITTQPVPNHNNQKYYKNPKEFRPERWESQCSANDPYTLNGFSGGPRNCIGKHLALLQSKITLVKFVKRYSKFVLPKQDFSMVARFLYEPELMEMAVTK